MGLFDRPPEELSAREKAAGLNMGDVLALPDAQRRLCMWLLRQDGASLPELMAHFSQDEAGVRTALDPLVEQAFVQETAVNGVRQFRMRLAARRRQSVPTNIWQSLDTKDEQ